MTTHHDSPDGAALRQARRIADLRQADVADALGVSRTRVANVELQRRVTPSFAGRYLAALAALASDNEATRASDDSSSGDLSP